MAAKKKPKTSDRPVKGYQLYQKGLVECIEADIANESYHFRIKGSNHSWWNVHSEEGSWLCECDDWRNHAPSDPGSFLCKHCIAAIFYLGKLKGIEEQCKLKGLIP